MRSLTLSRLFGRRPLPPEDEGARWPRLDDTTRLDGERLILRWTHASDADDIFVYAGDPAVSPFMDWTPHRRVEESRRFLNGLERSRRAGHEAAFAIVERQTSAVVGICSVVHLRAPGAAEIGYVLRRTAWGHGYMTEAVGLVSAWVFDTLRARELFADVHPDNLASQRVLEKCGFTRLSETFPRTIKGRDLPHYRYRLSPPR